MSHTTSEQDDIEQVLFPTGRYPREHHAGFSHHELREALFFDPEYTVSLMNKKAPDVFINELWHMLQGSSLEDYFAEFPDWTMTFQRTKALGNNAILIKMPPPQADLECFYMCIVAFDDDEIGYYTLEMCSESGCSDAMFCAWNDEQTHLNFGQIEISERNFLNGIKRRLDSGYRP